MSIRDQTFKTQPLHKLTQNFRIRVETNAKIKIISFSARIEEKIIIKANKVIKRITKEIYEIKSKIREK